MKLGRIVAVVMLFLMSSAAQAWPIAYVVVGNVTGSIGATPLTGEHFNWVLFSDTDWVVPGPPFTSAPASDQGMFIGGIGGVGSLLPFQFLLDPTTGQAAFADLSLTSGIAFSGPGLVGYDAVSTPWWLPVTLDGALDVPTNLGTLVITDISNFKFTALLAIPAAPEPITLALFGAGLASVGALRRRVSSKQKCKSD